MTAHQYLRSLPHVPMTMLGNKPVIASNSERRRWLMNKAVIINGQTPGPDDEIITPIWELVFFPKSEKRKTTMVWEPRENAAD